MARTATEEKDKAGKAKSKEGKKSKKKLVILIAVVAILVAAAVSYFLFFSGAKTKKPVPIPVDYSFPQLTTNLDDGHIVQVDMTLVLKPGDLTAEVNRDLPKLQNAAILTFGQMSFSQLSPTSGRLLAESQLTDVFNSVLHSGPKPWDTVLTVEFTSFIIQ
jgi:flagellar FliL protein